MAHILIMPRQGNTVESCIITNWKVKEGDPVTPETVVCEVETDKAAFEVPAGVAGTVLKLLFAAGDDVPVLKPIAVIGAAGEDWKTVIGENTQETSRKGAKAQREEQIEPPSSSLRVANQRFDVPLCDENSELYVSPRARNFAAKEALPLSAVLGTGPGGRIIERDVIAALKNRPYLTAAAKAAGAATVPSGYVGSGIGGRVAAADLAAVEEELDLDSHSPFPTPHSPLSSEGAISETPIKGIRKVISDRMLKSLSESAQFTINASAPAAKLQEFRMGVKSQGNLAEELGLSKITINDLILFAVARTLPRFPYMNAHKTGEIIKTFERVHLAFAVDSPRGLMVPVIRNANLLSLAQISSEAKRLATVCQNGTVNPDELSGSTFSVSNLGSFGVTSFTPVLNMPEVAVLGVCGIELKPVAGTDGVRFEPHIGFSLTINHQAVDGAPAARFLKALCEAVAHIDLLLAAG
jgi:pyruvate dehydrogenase E2 component (dihydrolipoamide acetyltransferase)